MADPLRADKPDSLLEATFDAAHDAIIAVDLTGRVAVHNRRYLTLFGLTAADLERGGGVDGLVETLWPQIENLEELRRRSDDVWSSGEDEIADLVRFRDGRVVERFIRHYTIGGRIAGIVASFNDVSQSVLAERALEDQLRQSQKVEALGRLAGGIAHDLNNALTTIAGYSELALGQLDPSSPVRGDIEEIRRGAERAGSVTRQLLAFSRKELLAPRLFDLNQTISALGRLLSRLLGPDVEVRTELEPAVPGILGDQGQFEQAVINLAVNARDAMPCGGRLVLSTSVEEVDEGTALANTPMSPGRYVVLRVSDTGQGMTAETLAHVFEPFFTTKAPGKGTGLGLSMVYGTLKQIGGFIFADSAVGAGTTFRLYLRPAAPLQEGPPGTPTIDTAASRSQPTILVVEGERAVRNLVASALRKEGYRLLLGGSAEEAVRLADEHAGAIDLLLTEAIMPGMSGIELAEALVAKRPHLQVIVMSGYTDDVLGGLDHNLTLLKKPFAPEELRQRVRAAIDQVGESSR